MLNLLKSMGIGISFAFFLQLCFLKPQVWSVVGLVFAILVGIYHFGELARIQKKFRGEGQ